ncbi:ninjurin-A-like [Sabethes cyaneus]|uniref:ninjurin-A-like n=1 Tax=Sabethes cyaneus TaxID=53552 RepID=UPI00237DBD67|nr:ninjurin-A-like [Sabethes cyaneus]
MSKMSNTADTDSKHVEITIDNHEEGHDEESTTDKEPITPIVAEAINQPKDGRRSPRANTDNRGRQLDPEATGGRNSRSGSRSPNRRVRRDADSARNDAIPLLPSDEGRLPRQQPPLAGPEMDDDGPDDDRRTRPNNNRGIDDGFLDLDGGGGVPATRNPGRGNNNPQPFPYGPDYGPDGNPIITTTTGTRVIPDVNVYQQKKNLAQGMMDLALLSANANQLRYVLESYSRHPYFYFSLVFISTSIICQVAVGIGLIWKSRYNIKNQDQFCKADRINNMVTIGIFLITLVNVLISAFGVAEPPRAA